MGFNIDEKKLLFEFLGRADLKGKEVPAFNKVLLAIERESKSKDSKVLTKKEVKKRISEKQVEKE